VKQPGIFLTADWRNLLMFNYSVDPGLLQPFVPYGTELDAFEGRTYVSLVGFEFNRTRVTGFTIPFHRSFEEVNLRFYVRRAGRRGVVFIRELVPKLAVAAIARIAFGENYSRVPMAHSIHTQPETGAVEAEYCWGSGPSRCSMRLEAGESSFVPPDNSLGQFITEHYWGYSARADGGCLEYEVQHPRWLVREAKTAIFLGDATHYYGVEFGKLLMLPPDSAFLAEGSPVTVFKGVRVQ
jgi:uncharacterized protein YqjF (DUF2071 family)